MADNGTWIGALRSSHDLFSELVTPLDAAGVRAPSYASEWSIADVASHLGSQAEIFGLFVDAGLAGKEPPGGDAFGPIWEVWNKRSPEDQVAESVAANQAFVQRLEVLSAAEQAAFALSMFGSEFDLARLAAMRLGEHAVHTWDVAVALDPKAEVAPDAVDLLVDTLEVTAGRAGKPLQEPRDIVISTTAPERGFVLATGPEVSLSGSSGPADLQLPAEAFVRLVFGRLDPDHTPASITGGELLPSLRTVFPGF
jgi:uncharacterized protein (TIGR03083 family)